MTRKIFVSLMTIFDPKNIHTQRAKFDFIAYRNQACEFGINPHSHTWLPYITPNGVRLSHEIS